MTDPRTQHYTETLQKLIRMETISEKGNGNPEKFRRFHTLLAECFPTLFSLAEKEDVDGSLLLRWPGKTKEAPLLLMSHHDVVEAGSGWTHEPFSGDVADGKLWGRGTLDTKGSLFAILQAAEELASEGFVPKTDIYIESACTEETSGEGADKISQLLLKRGIRFSMVIDEGGMILHDPIGGADGTFAMVGVGEKGCADLRFVARSSGGHASMPGKNTPLVRLGKFMAAAEKAKLFPAYLNPVTEEMFRRMAPTMKGALGFLFRNVRFFRPLLTRVMPTVSDTAGAMLKTTLAFTMAGGSDGSNVLPQEAWVMGNMRFSHHQGQEKSFEAVRKLAKKYDVEMEIADPGFPSGLSDYRTDSFRKLEKAVSAVFPGVITAPYIMTGASDCRFFTRVCENCFRFAPFIISDQQLASIHGKDENVDLSALAPAVDFFKHIMQEN